PSQSDTPFLDVSDAAKLNAANSLPLTAEAVLKAIQAMPDEERDRLFEALAQSGSSGQYAVIRRDVLEHLEKFIKQSCDLSARSDLLLVETANEAYRRGKCSRVKRDRTASRDKEITNLLEVGFTEPDKILDHLRDHHPKLVSHVRSAEIMMRDYHKRRQRRTDCN